MRTMAPASNSPASWVSAPGLSPGAILRPRPGARAASMEFVIQGQPKKLESYKAVLTRAGVTDEEVAYVGDDLPDLPILQRVGLGVAVANAVVEVKRAAHYVTVAKGGEGAVREVVELILKAQGRWKKAIPQALA